jgi:hypothetical protein
MRCWKKYHAASCDIKNEYVSASGTVCWYTTKKTKAIRNEIQLLESINSVIQLNNVQMGKLSQKTYHFSLRLNTRLSWFNYSQTLILWRQLMRGRVKMGCCLKRPTGKANSVLVTIGYSFQGHKITFETDALIQM